MKTLLCVVGPLALLLSLSPPCPAAEYDWPQWMGPNRDGLSQEKGLLQKWPEEGPPQTWLVRSVGLGYAGPSIAEGKIYILGALDGVTHLMCLDEATGERQWATPIGPEYENDWGNGPRCTPTYDGDHVYAMSGTGQLICCQTADGKKVWQVAMQDFGGKTPQWGYCESPLVDGERVVVTPGGEKGSMIALNKQTGSLLWQSQGVTEGAQYASIVKSSAGGRDQYVQLLHKVFGVNPDDGSVLWQQDWQGLAVIPTPLIRGNKVYVSTGYGVGCRLIDLGESGTDPTTVYDNKVMKNKHDGLALLGDHLYGYSDGVGWLCQDFNTGERVWRERNALGKGSIGYADGRLYCLSEDEGEVVLINATPEGWEEHGRFKLSPQTEQRKPRGRIWVHPVIANGKLYLRDQELLFQFNVKQ
ncbi:outer membrane biogenesis protein BamB [Posidoniimonas corsicana]|uniref:Outer membrane biogenesis protein BamB n=1 Tax=Posidoniimonas corsicana TaxID=1938618 RepID=A0A5C5VGB0_9BACT|nr:PQQ-binding-like beta-propeller repeat protein [Posidoniimonas corsicana]TWT36735.1 outer membrane biogenesis protein BamB [Posidoniimonas corsicana]